MVVVAVTKEFPERIQELLGHKDVSKNTVYTHVLSHGRKGVLSPADNGNEDGVPRNLPKRVGTS